MSRTGPGLLLVPRPKPDGPSDTKWLQSSSGLGRDLSRDRNPRSNRGWSAIFNRSLTVAENRLGYPTEETNRDAVHVAVIPAVLVTDTIPGSRVRITDGRAYPSGATIGVVDPFLSGVQNGGTKVWVLLDPGTVTGLRHEWSHPDIPEPASEVVYVDYGDECRGCD